jgi:hypothetical protein
MPGVAESMSGSAIARWLMENPSLKWMIQRYPHFKPSYFNFESFISFILGIQSDLFISINWFSWQVRQVSTNPMSFVSILEHILILVSVLPRYCRNTMASVTPYVVSFWVRQSLRHACARRGFPYAKQIEETLMRSPYTALRKWGFCLRQTCYAKALIENVKGGF